MTPSTDYCVPTWDPNYSFSFPVSKFLVVNSFSNELTQGDFQSIQNFAEGSNSDIFLATYNSNQVIVKMLKKRLCKSRVALQELHLEHGMLARLSHPNVVKILGAGDTPQKFIVLEYLGGGTLQQLLHPPSDRKSTAILNFPLIFKKRTVLPLDRCLVMARDIATALKYLHEDCCEGATIIHRDLKPENIGFTSDMQLKLFDFQSIQNFAEGSNSDVFLATYNSNQVIVKMLKKRLCKSRVALQELHIEHGMLARLSHPNIVKILGAGDTPQKFLVLEYLGGGTLQQLLHPPTDRKSTTILNFPLIFKKRTVLPLDRCLVIARDIATALKYLHEDCCEGATIIHRDLKPENIGFTSDMQLKLFDFGLMTKKYVIPLDRCLIMARDIATALKYLHEDCCEGATIIHRDLKPENIGFTSDMQLKLFDFGLMTCVKKRSHASEVYEMTGNTGSLRYMAPEVALKRAYNEKVDVHSFGMILWEMLTGKLPYKGVSKAEFMSTVVGSGYRPKIPKDLPVAVASLLKACWEVDAMQRPSSAEIIAVLSAVIDDTANEITGIYKTQSESSSITDNQNGIMPSTRRFAFNDAKSSWF
eukprot:CAMPEP_0201112506 /NCGR_PEP_ID=MMETSP0812-20130820/77296_1 /ASSEMBLY_ACC=CAM_ASM_000668 /TAXON_ID=98059 /ORGANISM="Dinobryon sp., Strain UTEXLB2267" /LENGTH=588 /DNA_ID=CAMNT_0047375877 /DNA_START=674 /DNA_END=2440 /DNA_ORIENTATION=+